DRRTGARKDPPDRPVRVFKRTLRGLAIAGLLAFGNAAVAGEAQDRLFALGVLDSVETGQELVYGFERRGDFPPDKLSAVTDGVARLDMRAGADGKRAVVVALNDGARDETFDPFPADAGNPIFMVFMEQNVRAMAALTGGSPFYIRNRMREALGAQDSVTPVDATYDGRTVPARRVSFKPFAGDGNREKMGPFAQLEISFVMSDAVPGEFVSMDSVTGPGPKGEPLMRLAVHLDGVEKED
ncbi:MAG: hypothetical protein ABTQ27_17770, partial [Amaricoccus sp.]|uniref:hypothetical protein n=1 Tax=Amaricoccus sp. TaxID=1872485 RepID=UPI003314A0EC